MNIMPWRHGLELSSPPIQMEAQGSWDRIPKRFRRTFLKRKKQCQTIQSFMQSRGSFMIC
jgi:hypothetical protein